MSILIWSVILVLIVFIVMIYSCLIAAAQADREMERLFKEEKNKDALEEERMNKTVLIGRLTNDPDLRFAAGSGTAVTRLTLAVNRMKKDDGADFINCIAFGKTGETIAQYVQKGQQLAISGRIQTGSYDAKDGTKRYTTDVVIEGFDFIGTKAEGGQQQNNNSIGGPVDDFSGMSEDMDGGIPF